MKKEEGRMKKTGLRTPSGGRLLFFILHSSSCLSE
jgi:hypothetical protein